MKRRELVAVIDDDESVRESLPDLIRELGFDAVSFASAEETINSSLLTLISCFVVDVNMPSMSGPDFFASLQNSARATPFVFITARVDERVRNRLLKNGAVACLYKPFSDEEFLAALTAALLRLPGEQSFPRKPG